MSPSPSERYENAWNATRTSSSVTGFIIRRRQADDHTRHNRGGLQSGNFQKFSSFSLEVYPYIDSDKSRQQYDRRPTQGRPERLRFGQNRTGIQQVEELKLGMQKRMADAELLADGHVQLVDLPTSCGFVQTHVDGRLLTSARLFDGCR